MNYVRRVPDAAGELTAEGTIVRADRRSAVVEGKVTDATDRLYATGSTTCLVFDLPAA